MLTLIELSWERAFSKSPITMGGCHINTSAHYAPVVLSTPTIYVAECKYFGVDIDTSQSGVLQAWMIPLQCKESM